MKALTQGEVDVLTVGAGVAVTWSGGNGPHNYLVGRDEGGTYVTIMGDTQQRVGYLDRVGDYPLTQVSLRDEE